MTAPMPPQAAPQAPPMGGPPPQPVAPQPLPPPVAPWTPFQPRPNDSEPAIAALWMKRLSKVMSTVKFSSMPPEWQQCLSEKYMEARTIVAQSMAPPPEQQGQQPPAKGAPGKPPSQSPKPQPPTPTNAGTRPPGAPQ